MIEGILGRKVGMTQLFAADGTIVPVTVVEAGPCVVVQRKTTEKDGYEAVQVGLVEKVNANRVTKPMKGHFAKAGVAPMRKLAEFRVEAGSEASAGEAVTVTEFAEGDVVDVIGTSKGKGFAGLIKRHHFGGGRATHGSMFHRAPGSIGSSAYPSRVFRGMRMTGRMGGDRVTVRNLRVARVDAENNLIFLRGAVPGGHGAILRIRKVVA
jgi:large subunit ribosomal protein L3